MNIRQYALAAGLLFYAMSDFVLAVNTTEFTPDSATPTVLSASTLTLND